MLTADDVVLKLNLEKHREGGYFKRVYESKHQMLIPGYAGERYMATAILYLLSGNDFSAFHRIKSDEIWTFNYGSPLTIYTLDASGGLNKMTLGDFANPIYQVTISANQWFAAEINDKQSFSLLSCFVIPGFEYSDFELAKREDLALNFPNHVELIHRLTRDSVD